MPSLTGAKASKSISLRLALVHVPGKVFNVVNTSAERETKMFMVCPSCQSSRLHQVNCCNAGCKPGDGEAEYSEGWTTGEIALRGKEVEDEIVVMTEEEIAAAKAPDLPDGILELNLHPAEQLEGQVEATGTTYFFDPDRPDAAFAMLREQVLAGDVAIIGNLAMRSAVKLYRLYAGPNGGLLLREMVRPEAMHRFEEIRPPEPRAKERTLFEGLVVGLTEDFNPEMYASESLKNLRELISSKFGGAEITPITKAKKSEDDGDIASLLEASLAAIAKAKVS